MKLLHVYNPLSTSQNPFVSRIVKSLFREGYIMLWLGFLYHWSRNHLREDKRSKWFNCTTVPNGQFPSSHGSEVVNIIYFLLWWLKEGMFKRFCDCSFCLNVFVKKRKEQINKWSKYICLASSYEASPKRSRWVFTSFHLFVLTQRIYI